MPLYSSKFESKPAERKDQVCVRLTVYRGDQAVGTVTRTLPRLRAPLDGWYQLLEEAHPNHYDGHETAAMALLSHWRFLQFSRLKKIATDTEKWLGPEGLNVLSTDTQRELQDDTSFTGYRRP